MVVSIDMLAFPEITERADAHVTNWLRVENNAMLKYSTFQYAMSTHPATGYGFQNTRYPAV